MKDTVYEHGDGDRLSKKAFLTEPVTQGHHEQNCVICKEKNHVHCALKFRKWQKDSTCFSLKPQQLIKNSRK